MTDAPSLPPRVRLVVLFGGVSAEHEVSCVSARHVLAAADPGRYDLVPIGITREGRWVLSEATSAALADGPSALPESLRAEGPVLEPAAAVAPPTAAPDVPVVVFPLVHGPMGEDGTVQGLLEVAGVPYVGSGVLGSAVCMDKSVAKVIAGAAGLPQARWLGARDVDAGAAFRQRVADELGFPAFVKPANLGSSVGISRADDAAALDAAIDSALGFDEYVVVEEAVNAREIEVGVLGNERPRASVPGEIVPTHEFYDYDDKYVEGAARMEIPADLPPAVADDARRLAVEAYRVLRCDGFARCDFFYEAQRTDGTPGRGLLLNELNTIPGFTPFSMFPSLWAATGVSYADLIDEMVALALARHRHRSSHRRTDR